MTTTERDEIGELLRELVAPGAFSARRTAPADDLHLDVEGLGRLRMPVDPYQAEELCRLARPARYGRGEETLLDSRVRDTWEVPKSRVKIDRRRFDRSLQPVLDGLRADLGLPEGARLRAELHSMLVYAPGQFFLPHQDSEKTNEMVGTLVVTLPGSFQGGALRVEHRGKKRTYRGTPKSLSFVAFYADCLHEVRPVTDGHRIVLTYNLMLQGDGTVDAAAGAPPEAVDVLARRLRAHFETPLPPRWAWQKDAPPREPPDRLVYLLDYQYTERGFGWKRLKGDDAARVAALRAAAEQAGCEALLALAEVHESWSCFEPGWDEPRYGRHRRWERDEDDEWAADYELPSADDPDAYDLQDLIDSGITLDRWVDASSKETEPIATHVGDEELCFTTPSSDLEPYASEYEGYMGNWGNTMDRWYRRGAVVLWPRERAFAVRAEASPAWALQELEKRLKAGEADEAREMAESLRPFWEAAASREERRGFFVRALRVAEGLDRPELAASLLEPFRVEAQAPGGAKAFAALVARYGEGWTRNLLAGWTERDRPWARPEGRDRPAWLASFPRLCEALCLADEAAGAPAARLLLEDSWSWLRGEIEGRRKYERPSFRDEALAKLARPLLAFLESAALVGTDDLREEAVAFLSAEANQPLVPCLVGTLRAAVETVEPALWPAAGLEKIREHCVRVLQAQLAEPPRADGDWSIALPEGCDCDLCATLGAFLADAGVQRLEWPIAKEQRKHVHGKLDAHELPVTHETRRSGSPYTLVLTKTEALFEREAAARRTWQANLAWLTGK